MLLVIADNLGLVDSESEETKIVVTDLMGLEDTIEALKRTQFVPRVIIY